MLHATSPPLSPRPPPFPFPSPLHTPSGDLCFFAPLGHVVVDIEGDKNANKPREEEEKLATKLFDNNEAAPLAFCIEMRSLLAIATIKDIKAIGDVTGVNITFREMRLIKHRLLTLSDFFSARLCWCTTLNDAYYRRLCAFTDHRASKWTESTRLNVPFQFRNTLQRSAPFLQQSSCIAFGF